MTELRGDLHARGRRFAIAVARFNELVTRKLLRGALASLHANGVAEEDVDVAWVPGAFELPLVARRLAASQAPLRARRSVRTRPHPSPLSANLRSVRW